MFGLYLYFGKAEGLSGEKGRMRYLAIHNVKIYCKWTTYF
jgi:hypothetical protein